MQPSFLTPAQLADRWHITITTLSQWRWNGRGPEFHKIGGRVSYQLQDVEQFEMSKRRRNTSEHPSNDSTFLNRSGRSCERLPESSFPSTKGF
jgi:hypothetical protein